MLFVFHLTTRSIMPFRFPLTLDVIILVSYSAKYDFDLLKVFV